MKRTIAVRLLTGLIAFTALAAFAGSAAWFIPTASIDPDNTPIEGETMGAYFAYGDGTPEHPYGITKPRHVYNLAWLQYLGMFNEVNKTTSPNYNRQFHFEVAADVDMGGIVIPPIGTTEFPFVGELQGKDHIISNFSTSNDFSDLKVHPAAINSGNFKSNVVKIVGFFGVVGNYQNQFSGQGITYSSEVNTVSHLGLTDFEVKTISSDTLIGMAAGYVDADVSNVAVNAAKITVGTGAGTSVISPATKVSEHSVVGYTTKKQDVTRVDQTVLDTYVSQGNEFNATDSQGDNQGWGGSVNMMKMYQRIYAIHVNNVATTVTEADGGFGYRKYQNYLDGVANGSPTYDTNNYVKRYVGGLIGNFNIYNRTGNTSYMYLLGGHYEVNYNYTSYDHAGSPIQSGSNYIYISNGEITNTTNSSLANLWTIPETSGLISTNWESTSQNYYLRNNGGSLELTQSSSSATTWTITRNGDDLDIVNDGYKLLYYDNNWTLVNTSGIPYYRFSFRSGSNTRYLGTASNNAISVVNNTSGAANWRTGSSGHYYYTTGNTRYYLSRRYQYSASYYDGYYVLDSNYPFTAISNGSQTSYYTFDGTHLVTTGDILGDYDSYYDDYGSLTKDATLYAYFSSNSWSSSTSSSTTFTRTIVGYDPVPGLSDMHLVNTTSTTRKGADNYYDNTAQGMHYTATDTTYFPLNVKEDGGTFNSRAAVQTAINNGNFNPKDGNTGYVISGSIIDSTGDFNYGASSIRVSKYAKSNASNNISNSFIYTGNNYASGTITNSNVRTINASGKEVGLTTAMVNSFQKYSDSKDSLLTVLRSDSNNYGLHFVSSATTDIQISTDHIVQASNISILGTTYPTYEMPVNSIDFNLKQKGYINFFAGSYYNEDVSTFFSLHQVVRNGTAISAIKEIQNIYASEGNNNYSYIYEYKDGTYYEPYRFDGTDNRYYLPLEEGDSASAAYSDNYSMDSTKFNKYVTKYGFTSVFNTDRITNYRDNNGTPERIINKLSQNYLFYFEIPMNKGEFCLGSVKGGDGGYLLYLDIGANAEKYQRTAISEHYKIVESVFQYPIGFAIVSYSANIDEKDSICAIVPTGFAGKSLSIEHTDNNMTLLEIVGSSSSAANLDISFIGESINANIANLQEKLKPKSTTEKDIKRLQYFDYNINLGETIRTVITDTTINSSTTRVVEQFDNSGNAIAEANWKIYRTKDGAKIDNATIKSASSLAIDSAASSGGLGWTDPGTTVLLKIYYIVPTDGSVTAELKLEVIVDPNNTSGTYYKFNDYVLLVTPTGSGINVHVVTKGSKTISVNNTPVTQTGQVIPVPLPG